MMKKFLLSLLKAAVYTGVFLGIQIIVTLILSVGAAFYEEIRRAVTGEIRGELDIMGNIVSWVTVISCLLTLLFLLFVFAVRGKSFSDEVRWHKLPSAGRAMLGPLECGFGLSILSSFVLALIPFPEAWYATYDESMEMMLAGDPLFLAIATVLAAPIVEEVIFRGLVYTRLCRGMKRWLAALVSALIFGLVHGTLLHLVFTVPMGLVLCLFYEKYRSLWAPILLHMSFNLAGSVLGYYNIESPVVVIVLIAAGLYLTVIGLLSMRWYRRDYLPQPAAPILPVTEQVTVDAIVSESTAAEAEPTDGTDDTTMF